MRFAALVFLVACGSSKPAGTTGGTGSGPPPTKAELDTCTKDEECALVEACCGCNAGGRKVAIRADAVADYEKSRPQRCASEVCTQMMSEHLSCDAEAVCGQNGHCKPSPHMKHQ